MTYTEEQRTIIRRMGEISARIEAFEAQQEAAQAAISQNILDIATHLAVAANNLAAAMDRSNTIGAMHRQWGDAFREFLDTL